MNKLQIIDFANNILNENITILKQIKSGKWYEQEYTSNFTEIETECFYGVIMNSLDGSFNTIDYIFKTGKKYDNILKTFVTQYISKYATKTSSEFINGSMVYPTKEKVLNNLKNNDIVTKHFFYTTLYGIGWFCFLSSQKAFIKNNEILINYLTEKNIKFKNEFSEAGWVYRFVLNDNIKKHNELLKNLNF